MAYSIQGTEYYRGTIPVGPGEAYEFLSTLAELGVNLEAFTAVPSGPDHVQLTLFAEDPSRLGAESARAGLALDGPHPAILVRGDDELGALAEVHRRLADASIAIYASSGMATGTGSFGYLVYVREDQFSPAMKALETD
jgi:hypothetical protein